MDSEGFREQLINDTVLERLIPAVKELYEEVSTDKNGFVENPIVECVM